VTSDFADHRRWHEPERLDTPPTFHGMVGCSAAMRRVFEQIARLAASPASVLIAGETGTGKEIIASAIHAAGPRARRPFVAVNCAALPRELVESELFGHVRGAFSGATADHLGLVRAAAGGTLLLDEITEMLPELQAKLLRVLQERCVRPIGALTEIPVDARIIASTNRDPRGAMQSGLLRPDLYYRLSVNQITVPPLRERPVDIAVLVEHCLARLNDRWRDTVQPPRGITPEALDALTRQGGPATCASCSTRSRAHTRVRAAIASVPAI
jgi:transcriptional regulator with PAS, ATPase and Fis domain